MTSNKPVGNEQLELNPFQEAFNDGVEAAKTVIRDEPFYNSDEANYVRSCLINAIARKTNPYAYKASAPVQGDVISRAEADRKLNDLTEWFCYWLLRAYQSGHREGWEPSPSTSETMSDLLNVLANAGFDPSSEQAKELLKQRFAVFYTLPATSPQATPEPVGAIEVVKRLRDKWKIREKAHLDTHQFCVASYEFLERCRTADLIIKELESLAPSPIERLAAEQQSLSPEIAQALNEDFGKLYESAPSVPTQSEWQPIETAPKDGTRVLLGFAHFGAQHDVVAHWTAGDWSANGDGIHAQRLHGRPAPTHWMPLPAPPVSTSEGE